MKGICLWEEMYNADFDAAADEEIMKVIVAKYDDLEQVKVAFENGDWTI